MDVGVNYKNNDFVEKVMSDTKGRGADVVVDSIAGKDLTRSIQSLAYGGRVITEFWGAGLGLRAPDGRKRL
ncbi:zinc-binding dehydrogenase [Caballeronia glathei]|uniref:zinc-binding dehydrogenase n=1 Tax=Caballeronia glathei TaxID=60547 RepID=UPI001E368A87|nr:MULTISPECIES: zinc-binding dehydrogenase [Burkholderiaceae]